jgi:predicted transporter
MVFSSVFGCKALLTLVALSGYVLAALADEGSAKTSKIHGNAFIASPVGVSYTFSDSASRLHKLQQKKKLSSTSLVAFPLGAMLLS